MKRQVAFMMLLSLLNLMWFGCGSDEVTAPESEETLEEQVGELPKVDPELEQKIATLVTQLSDPNVEIRRTAVLKLVEIHHPATVPGLMKALSDENQEIRVIAENALVGLGDAAVPALVRALGDEESEYQDAAANVLVKMGGVAIPGILQELSTLSQREFSDASAERSIERIGEVIERIDEAAIPALTERLNDKDSLIRVVAARWLYKLDASKRDVTINILTAALNEKGAARVIAAVWLYDIDPSKVNAVTQALVLALDDPDTEIRVVAAVYLYDLDKTKTDKILTTLKGIDTPQARQALTAIERDLAEQAKIILTATSPAQGGEVLLNSTLTLTFSDTPPEVTVMGTPAVVTGKTATWQVADVQLGQVRLQVGWKNKDGSQNGTSLTYSIVAPDVKPPELVSSTIGNSQQDVDPELDEILLTFDEPLDRVKTDAFISDEQGNVLNWGVVWQGGDRVIVLEVGKGGLLAPGRIYRVSIQKPTDQSGNVGRDVVLSFSTSAPEEPELALAPPLIYYNFENVQAIFVPDESGHAYDARAEGPMGFGNFGGPDNSGAGWFHPKNAYLRVSKTFTDNPTPTRGITIAVWVNFEDTGADPFGGHVIVHAVSSDGQKAIGAQLLTNPLAFDWEVGGAGIRQAFPSLAWKQWYHFAGTYDASTGEFALYINGLRLRRSQQLGGALTGDWKSGLYIGGPVDDTIRGDFVGKMDDFVLYDRVLSQDEIKELMRGVP